MGGEIERVVGVGGGGGVGWVGGYVNDLVI